MGSPRVIADIFGVRLSGVETLLPCHRPTGEMAAKPHAGGQRPRVGTGAQAQVRRRVHDQPVATLEESCLRAAEMTGIRGSVPTMCQVGRRLGWPRKTRLSMRPSATLRGASRHAQTDPSS